MNTTMYIAVLAAIAAVVVLIMIFNGKLRQVVTGCLRICIAFGGLILFNIAGAMINFTVGANLLNAAIIGLLGVPGIAVLLFVKWMFPGV